MANPFVQEPMAEGRIKLRTTLGDIEVELWPKEAPKACRNFVQLCMEGFYDGLIFHRVVPDFIAQTGDPTGTGAGGDCIYDEGSFEDEFSARLKFNRRGLVAMANTGKRNTNTSQFFFTLDRADELQNKNTIFGSVIGDTVFNVLKLNDLEIAPNSDGRPVYPPSIRSVEVVVNPFDDVVPRVTPEERKRQKEARKEAKADKEKQKLKLKHQKLAKNKGLLSFADDAEADAPTDPSLPKSKFLSAHDVDSSGRLSSQTAEGRRPVTAHDAIPSFVDQLPPGPTLATGEQKGAATGNGKVHPALSRGAEESAPLPTAGEEKKSKKSKGKEKAPELSESDKVKAEIAKLSADLKGSRRRGGDSSDSEDDRGRASAGKKTKVDEGPSGADLLAAERAKYTTDRAGGKGKKKREDAGLEDELDLFRKKLRTGASTARGATATAAAGADDNVLGYAGEWDETQDGALGDKDGDDEGWMDHALKFRKDATVDVHKAEEYAVVDPLAGKKWSLSELADRKMNRAAAQYNDNADRDKGRGVAGNGRSDRDRDRDRDGRRGDDYGGRFGGSGGGSRREYGDRGDRRDHRGQTSGRRY